MRHAKRTSPEDQDECEWTKARALAARKIEKAFPDALNGDSHPLLMAIYKDPEQPIRMRLKAAIAAAPYEQEPVGVIEVH